MKTHQGLTSSPSKRSQKWNSFHGVLNCIPFCFVTCSNSLSTLSITWNQSTLFSWLVVLPVFLPPASATQVLFQSLGLYQQKGWNTFFLIFLPKKNTFFLMNLLWGSTFSDLCRDAKRASSLDRALHSLTLPSSHPIRCPSFSSSFCSNHTGFCQFLEFTKLFLTRASLLSARNTIPWPLSCWFPPHAMNSVKLAL